jgi:hypothetical protein
MEVMAGKQAVKFADHLCHLRRVEGIYDMLRERVQQSETWPE